MSGSASRGSLGCFFLDSIKACLNFLLLEAVCVELNVLKVLCMLFLHSDLNTMMIFRLLELSG